MVSVIFQLFCEDTKSIRVNIIMFRISSRNMSESIDDTFYKNFEIENDCKNAFQRVIDYDLITISLSGGHVSVNPLMLTAAKTA